MWDSVRASTSALAGTTSRLLAPPVPPESRFRLPYRHPCRHPARAQPTRGWLVYNSVHLTIEAPGDWFLCKRPWWGLSLPPARLRTCPLAALSHATRLTHLLREQQLQRLPPGLPGQIPTAHRRIVGERQSACLFQIEVTWRLGLRRRSPGNACCRGVRRRTTSSLQRGRSVRRAARGCGGGASRRGTRRRDRSPRGERWQRWWWRKVSRTDGLAVVKRDRRGCYVWLQSRQTSELV